MKKWLLTIALLMSIAPMAQAAWRPDGVVTLVVPYSAGGGTDTVGRLLARKLAEYWKQSVIVENRAGADGVIGGSWVARARPDGRTLMIAVGSIAINPFVMPHVPTDPVKDFTPITMVGHSTIVMVSRPDLPEHSLAQFIAGAKQKPGSRTFASTEPSSRLYGEMLKELAGIDLLNVPYKGGSQLMTDLMAGQVDVGFTSVASAAPFLAQKKLRVLAVAAANRIEQLPDVPTFIEQGVQLPGRSWQGIFGPAGMSEEVVNGVYDALKTVLQDEDIKHRLSVEAMQPDAMAPTQFRAFYLRQLEENRALVQRAGMSISQ